MAWRLLLIVLCLLACELSAADIDDLASPSPAIRAAAARRLRDTYRPPAQSKWDSLVEKIHVGDLKADVLEQLSASKPKLESGRGSGPTTWEDYRLDDVWMFCCVFQGSRGEERLLSFSLREQYRYVHEDAQPDFTGLWKMYFINGQPSHEVHIKGGKKLGIFTAFHADGSRAYTMPYGPKGIDGENVGYFPSGKIKYRQVYREGEPIGPATYYHPDESVPASDK